MIKASTTKSTILIYLIAGGVFHLPGLAKIALTIENSSPSKILQSYSNASWEAIFTTLLPIAGYVSLGFILISLLIYLCIKSVEALLKNLKSKKTLLVHLSWSLVSWFSIIVINGHLFPDSIFTLSSVNSNSFLLFSICLICLSINLFPLINKYTASLSSFLVILGFLYSDFVPRNNQQPDQKNVIIIGIDSLRPEIISEHMPFLSKQLNNMTVFENAYTPIARTYPAWMSIMTGLHPINHGVRFNLTNYNAETSNIPNIATILKEEGYVTIYGSDEKRFSNIGKNHGFEHEIGPKYGAADFLLGKFGDFPLLNLIHKAPFISKQLFPFTWANRAAHHIYSPSDFSRDIRDTLDVLPNKPILLAIHYCLPHWPYKFSNQVKANKFEGNYYYTSTLSAVDNQIEDLFEHLIEKQILENSIVVLLSDHGESFGKIKTGLKNKEGKELITSEFGHGMNILSNNSQKVLLAVSPPKVTTKPKRDISSLIDITPTILGQLKIEDKKLNFDGIDLFKDNSQEERVITLETGLMLNSINSKILDPNLIAQEGASLYTLDQNGTLSLKENVIGDAISKKQVGIRIGNNSLLHAALNSPDKQYIYINHQNNTYRQLNSLLELKEESPLTHEYCLFFGQKGESSYFDCQGQDVTKNVTQLPNKNN